MVIDFVMMVAVATATVVAVIVAAVVAEVATWATIVAAEQPIVAVAFEKPETFG